MARTNGTVVLQHINTEPFIACINERLDLWFRVQTAHISHRPISYIRLSLKYVYSPLSYYSFHFPFRLGYEAELTRLQKVAQGAIQIIRVSNFFYRAMLSTALLCHSMLSVCLSVCLFVYVCDVQVP